MTRVLAYIVLLGAMIAFGFGVYRAATALKGSHGQVARPTTVQAPSLPGTMYLAQDGALYSLKGAHFSQITDNAGWMEPAVSPDGSKLVAVRRIGNYSDLYLLTPSGRVIKQLTHHAAQAAEANHWSFFPRFSPDGSQVFYSYDDKVVGSYEVDLTIFSIAIDSGAVVQWTVPNPYTGGDVQPLPLKGGGLIYTKYSIDDQSQVHSQIWYQSGPGTAGVALTQPADNCSAPDVSADGKAVVMVCRRDQLESADVVVEMLGADRSLSLPLTVAHGRLAASPAFSPDGRTVAFLAPVEAGGAFQLWTVPFPTSRNGSSAHAQTTDVGLDATSAPAWIR